MTARILVIDDEPAIRSSLSKFLRDRKGHHVDEAGHGAEGWKRMRAAEYDLVITDLVMPEVNGLEFIDRKSTRLNSSHSAKSRMPSSA